MAKTPQIYYITTDLDLVASRDLAPLAAALAEKRVFALSVTAHTDGRWYATLENDCDADRERGSEPEKEIVTMLDAVDSLRGVARSIWSKCILREFNIGYECGDEPWAFNNGLTNATLRRMAKVGATLKITIYSVHPPVRKVSPKKKRKAPRR
ncbi:MAG: hypothetical protein EXR98_11875 [Gemmataceae bacterium]|nr:hypothetical protein [Gemmataceae bacterium]